jgi:anthranilate phosphoribosyltransferase
VLNNAGPAGARSAVVLNAAGALYVGGLAPTYDDAVTLATEALQAGRGAVALATLRTATQRATA